MSRFRPGIIYWKQNGALSRPPPWKGRVIHMPESISPYALLCASRPKPAPTLVTAYDLYSQAQQRQEQSAPTARQPPLRPLSSVPARRTHYIADIHSRHSAALRHTPMQPHPLT